MSNIPKVSQRRAERRNTSDLRDWGDLRHQASIKRIEVLREENQDKDLEECKSQINFKSIELI